MTLNPCKPDLLARAKNRVKFKARATTSDDDIVKRRWIMVDLDPKRSAETSSTDDEMNKAIDLAILIRNELGGEGWPAPLMGMSGNGAYLLYRVDLPNDKTATDLVKRVLEGIAKRFETDAVVVDLTTFNAARLVKVLGTTARKGDDLRSEPGIPDRPHRRSWFEPTAGPLTEVSREQLEKMAAPSPKFADDCDAADGKQIERCKAYLEKCPDAVSGNNGHGATYLAACECFRFGLSRSQARGVMEWFNQRKTGGQKWSGKELEHKIEDAEKKIREAGEFASRTDKKRKTKGKNRFLSMSMPWEPFPVDVLPQAIRDYVSCAASAMRCDPAYVALPLMAGLGAAIGNSRNIRLKRGWDEPPLLWTIIVGESGTMKSPALDAATKFLRQRQDVAFADYELAVEAWEEEKEGERGKRPVCERFICSDVTLEALGPLLKDSPRGLLLTRDELNGWIKGFDQYKNAKGADVAHWLEFHKARSMTVDRKTANDPIYVPRPFVSVCGGIQPHTLKESLKKDYWENGLVARLLLCMPPRQQKQWTEDEIDADIDNRLSKVFDRLYSLDSIPGTTDPIVLPFTADAKPIWEEFYNQHNEEQSKLTGPLAAAYSKIEAYAPRFALIVSLASWADSDMDIIDVVDVKILESALRLVYWFKHEVARIYSILNESKDEETVRRLVELGMQNGGKLDPRMLMRSHSCYKTADDAEADLNLVVEQEFGEWDVEKRSRGRPSRFVRLYER